MNSSTVSNIAFLLEDAYISSQWDSSSLQSLEIGLAPNFLAEHCSYIKKADFQYHLKACTHVYTYTYTHTLNTEHYWNYSPLTVIGFTSPYLLAQRTVGEGNPNT